MDVDHFILTINNPELHNWFCQFCVHYRDPKKETGCEVCAKCHTKPNVFIFDGEVIEKLKKELKE